MSTNHYLVRAWADILEALDQENSVFALISVDFAKAFNSMSHHECLRSLTKMNCSNHLIGMIAAFLHGRKMQFKVENVISEQRLLRGGAPQGTLLGNYLFILTTDSFEKTAAVVPDLEELGTADSFELDGWMIASEEDSTDDEENITSTPMRGQRVNMSTNSTDGEDEFVFFREFRRPYNRNEDTGGNFSSNTLDG